MLASLGDSPAGAYPALPRLQRAAEDGAASALKQADGSVRADIQRALRAAGAEGTASAQIQYAIGPDGQRYAVGGSVVTSRVVETSRISSLGVADAPSQSLQDLTQRSLLSPSSFAEAFDESRDASFLNILRSADAATRGHEALHFRASGGLAVGLPQYEYVDGPDGRHYAVGGHVTVKTGASADPEKSQRDANTFYRAATAPGDVSGADMSGARSALVLAANAYAMRSGMPDLQAQQNSIDINA